MQQTIKETKAVLTLKWIESKKKLYITADSINLHDTGAEHKTNIHKRHILLPLWKNVHFFLFWSAADWNRGMVFMWLCASKQKRITSKNTFDHIQSLLSHQLTSCNILYTPIHSKASRICNKIPDTPQFYLQKTILLEVCLHQNQCMTKKKSKRAKAGNTVNHQSFIYN